MREEDIYRNSLYMNNLFKYTCLNCSVVSDDPIELLIARLYLVIYHT